LNKINIIYIASTGKSGSTLLETILDNHEKCFSLGEFQVFPIDLKFDLQPCGCSSKVAECQFWKDVYLKNKTIIDHGSIDRFRNLTAGKVLRWSELLEIFFNVPNKLHEINEYGYQNYTVLKTIKEKLNANVNFYLVDSSKDPYRLKWLQQSNLFNIKVLHVLKRPQSFVYSNIKNEKNFFMRFYKLLRMSARWIIQNIIIEKVVMKYLTQDSYLKIMYEDLAEFHKNEIARICKFLEIRQIEDIMIGEMHKNHAISGNMMRFGKSKIELDEKWKSHMTVFDKFLISVITLPFSFLLR